MISPSPTLVFIHVPKTAGSSMRALLFSAFGRGRVFWHGTDQDGFIDDAVRGRGASHFDRFAVIGGHIPYSNACLHSLPHRKIFAAILRRPVDQLVSHFEFISRRPDHPFHSGQNLEQALTSGSRFYQESINLQCRYISNRPTAAEALKLIADKAFILGSFDQVDLFVDRIATTFGLPPLVLPRRNVQEIGYFERHYTPAAAKVIARITAEDEALYWRVREEGVLTTFR